MFNTIESKTEIQINVPLSDESKIKCANEMLDAMSAISCALADIKDYQLEKKEELEQYEKAIANARSKSSDKALSKEQRLVLAEEIIASFNAMSEIEDDLKAYQTEKKAEIAKNEAIVNINRSKINRGKDCRWLEVKLIKDFDAKIKKFIDFKTGEVYKTLPMSDEDLQMELGTGE